MPGARWPVVQIADSSGDVTGASGTSSNSISVTQPAPAALVTEATTSRTSSNNGSNLTWPAGVTRAFVGVNLTALTGGTSPTVQVQLQQQDANGVFQVIGQLSAALSAVGVGTFSVGEGQTNGAVILSGGIYRLAWVITGAPATCSFQIGLSAR